LTFQNSRDFSDAKLNFWSQQTTTINMASRFCVCPCYPNLHSISVYCTEQHTRYHQQTQNTFTMFVVVVIMFREHRKNQENFKCSLQCFLQSIKMIKNSAKIYHVSDEEHSLLLDYLLVNRSLHNLPVNRIIMNMSF
jgi:hypothetical protein